MMHISRRVNAQTTAPRPLFLMPFVSSAMVRVCLEDQFNNSQIKDPQRKDNRTRNHSLIGSLWSLAPLLASKEGAAQPRSQLLFHSAPIPVLLSASGSQVLPAFLCWYQCHASHKWHTNGVHLEVCLAPVGFVESTTADCIISDLDSLRIWTYKKFCSSTWSPRWNQFWFSAYYGITRCLSGAV
jgi:hypothetical protein